MRSPQQVAERALRQGASGGGCVAIVDETATVHLRWARGALTTNGSARARRLTVVAIVNGAPGVVSRSGPLDDAAVADVVAGARRAAQSAGGEDPQPLAAGPAAGDWAEPPVGTDAAVLGEVAAGFGAAGGRARSHEALLSGYAGQQVRTTYLAMSTGLRRRHVQPTGVVDVTATCADGSASAWTGLATDHLGAVDAASLVARLDRGLGWPRRRGDLRPGRYEVLLAPSCVADLLLHVYRAAGARGALHGQSVFSGPDGRTRLGERLTPVPLTLRSDPGEPGLRCPPFTIARTSDDRISVFDNGLPLGPTTWISEGSLAALVQTRATARRTGRAHTAAIDNLVLEGQGDGAALGDMIARTERALLVTSLWYVRSLDTQRLLLTGLTRDGVHLVERGEVTAAMPDLRFNESPVELLARVAETGRTEPTLPREWGGEPTRVAAPALRVEGFTVAGVDP